MEFHILRLQHILEAATLSVMCNADHTELRKLRLEHILAAADLDTLQKQVGRKDAHGTPFLLQPLMSAPHLVEGEPNSRLLQLAQVLTKGAQLNGSAKAAAVAASAIQQMMMVSVCRGFTSAEGQYCAVTLQVQLRMCCAYSLHLLFLQKH